MMEILPTHKIPSAIIDIIDESEQYCFIVSPYLSLWPLLERSLSKAARQKKRITFIVRNDPSVNPIAKKIHDTYGFEIVSLNNLHAKLYLNERHSLITSMNLFDYSKEQNHEIGIFSDDRRFSTELLQEYVVNDLLQVKPHFRLSGYFDSDDRAIASEMLEFEHKLDKLGFCVLCGESINVEMSPNSRFAHFRCKKCYFADPDADSYELETKYCHLCGSTYDSTLEKPLHNECIDKIKNYDKWVNQGRRGIRPSV